MSFSDKLKSPLQWFDVRRRFFRLLGNSARILDLGCGAGYNIKALHSFFPNAEITGIDLYEKSPLAGSAHYLKVDLDLGALPFPNEHFDVVIITHVLEHMHQPLQLGPEIKRVLKVGGLLYVETPNWTSLFVPSFGINRLQQGPFNFFDDPTHLKPWSIHGLFNFIHQACQMKVVKAGAVRNVPKLLLDPGIMVIGFLTRNRLYMLSAIWNIVGWAIYAVGRKEA